MTARAAPRGPMRRAFRLAASLALVAVLAAGCQSSRQAALAPAWEPVVKKRIEWDRHMANGREAMARGDHGLADAKFLLALGALEGGSNRAARAETFIGIGDAEFGLGQFRESLDSYYLAAQEMVPLAAYHRDRYEDLRERFRRASAAAAKNPPHDPLAYSLTTEAAKAFSEDQATGTIVHRKLGLVVPREIRGWRRTKVGMQSEDGDTFFIRYRSSVPDVTGGFAIRVTESGTRSLRDQAIDAVRSAHDGGKPPAVREVRIAGAGGAKDGVAAVSLQRRKGEDFDRTDAVYAFRLGDRTIAFRPSLDLMRNPLTPEIVERAVTSFWSRTEP